MFKKTTCCAFMLCAPLLLAQEGLSAVAVKERDLTEERLAPYAKKGESTITGQAFLKTRGGDVKTGAGNEVILAPASEYIKTFYKLNALKTSLYIDLYNLGIENKAELEKNKAESEANKPDSRIISFIKTTTADASGNFEFKNLPSGEYMLFCNIYWETGKNMTGGMVYRSVKIGDGETQKIIVSETL